MNSPSWLALEDLPKRTDVLLAGVSGGADSVALAHLLHQNPDIEIPVVWIHIHHGLRGAESDADADFVASLAESLGVACRVMAKDVQGASRQPGMSVEMAARKARTEAFQVVASEYKHPVVLLAHTLEDQIETVLMKWMRGASPGAMGGMQRFSSREGLIFFRPLLHVHRQELRDWLEREGWGWREDSSNSRSEFLRNRVRNQVLPGIISTFGEPSVEAAAQQAVLQAEENAFLNQMAETMLGDEPAINLRPFRDQAVVLQRRSLVLWFARQGFYAVKTTLLNRVLHLIENHDGSQGLDVCEGVRVERQYDELHLVVDEQDDFGEVDFDVPGGCAIGQNRVIRCSEAKGFERQSHRTPGLPATGYVSARVLQHRPLTVRVWRAGDRISPVGLNGSRKKLQDIFTDAKIPASVRRQFPVVCCEDQLIWVPGYSVDDGWKVEGSDADSVKLEILIKEPGPLV